MPHRYEQLIGIRGIVEGREVEIIEVLHGSEEIILRECQAKNALLQNPYGDITRRTRETFTLPFRSELGDSVHPVLAMLLDPEQQNLLLDQD